MPNIPQENGPWNGILQKNLLILGETALLVTPVDKFLWQPCIYLYAQGHQIPEKQQELCIINLIKVVNNDLIYRLTKLPQIELAQKQGLLAKMLVSQNPASRVTIQLYMTKSITPLIIRPKRTISMLPLFHVPGPQNILFHSGHHHMHTIHKVMLVCLKYPSR